MKEKILVCEAFYNFIHEDLEEKFPIMRSGSAIVMDLIDDSKFDVKYLNLDSLMIPRYGNISKLKDFGKNILDVITEISTLINADNYTYVLISMVSYKFDHLNDFSFLVTHQLSEQIECESFVGGKGSNWRSNNLKRSDVEHAQSNYKNHFNHPELYDAINWPVDGENYVVPGGHKLERFLQLHHWKKFNIMPLGDGSDPSDWSDRDYAKNFLPLYINREASEGFLYPTFTPRLRTNSSNYDLLSIDYDTILKDTDVTVPEEYADKRIKMATITLSSGCPNRCSFCNHWWKEYTRHSIDDMKDVIMSYIDKGFNSFYFLDRTSNVWPEELFNWIVRRNLDIKWSSSFTARGTSLDYWKMVYEAGCRIVDVGFESVSPRMLEIINKKTTKEQLQECLDNANEANLIINCNFIVGMPGERPVDIRENIDFIHENSSKIGSIAMGPYTLLGASDYYDNPEKYGIRIVDPDHDYDTGYVEVDTWLSTLSGKQLAVYKRKLDSFIKNDVFGSQKELFYFPQQHLVFSLFDVLKDVNLVHSKIRELSKKHLTEQLNRNVW